MKFSIPNLDPINDNLIRLVLGNAIIWFWKGAHVHHPVAFMYDGFIYVHMKVGDMSKDMRAIFNIQHISVIELTPDQLEQKFAEFKSKIQI